MNNKWRNHFNQEALCILLHKERWKKTNNDVNDTAYSNETIDTNETMPDSIMLNARGTGLQLQHYIRLVQQEWRIIL
jgi:hypothetical protein